MHLVDDEAPRPFGQRTTGPATPSMSEISAPQASPVVSVMDYTSVEDNTGGTAVITCGNCNFRVMRFSTKKAEELYDDHDCPGLEEDTNQFEIDEAYRDGFDAGQESNKKGFPKLALITFGYRVCTIVLLILIARDVHK